MEYPLKIGSKVVFKRNNVFGGIISTTNTSFGNNTYNMTVFSRIRTESISKEIFNQFSENNTEIAWKYAFSQEVIRKNNVEADWESVAYEILYPNFSVEDLININEEMISFQIRSSFDFNMRLSTVIRACLELSSSKLNLLLESEAVYFNEKIFLKKYKFKNGDVVKINRMALINTYLIGKEDLFLNTVDGQ